MDNHIEPDKHLPENIAIKSAGSHLYLIGLSNFKIGSKTRNAFHNPILIFAINSIQAIKFILSLLFSRRNSIIRTLIADGAYYLEAILHLNSATLLLAILALLTQIHNYFNQNELSFLKPLQMISGSISPQSIGFTQIQDIKSLLKMTKISFFVSYLFTMIAIPFVAFTFSFVSLYLNLSLIEFIVFGIPNTILWTLYAYYSYNFLFWQINYLFLICYYLKCKLRRINQQLSNRIKNKVKSNDRFIIGLVCSLTLIYSEINDYDRSYWCIFLLIVFATFTSIINATLYLILFTEMNLMLRISCLYVVFVFSSALIFIIGITSSVTYEANKVYKLLYSYEAINLKSSVSIRKKIKVCIVLIKIKFNFKTKIFSFYRLLRESDRRE